MVISHLENDRKSSGSSSNPLTCFTSSCLVFFFEHPPPSLPPAFEGCGKVMFSVYLFHSQWGGPYPIASTGVLRSVLNPTGSEYLNTRLLVHDELILILDKLISNLLVRMDKLKNLKIISIVMFNYD